jgi:hypothetical protein
MLVGIGEEVFDVKRVWILLLELHDFTLSVQSYLLRSLELVIGAELGLGNFGNIDLIALSKHN